MHICFICNEYPPETHGGVGTFTQTMARAVVCNGHKATVIGISPFVKHDALEDDRGVRVLRLPHSRLRFSGFLLGGIRIRKALGQVNRKAPVDVLEGPEASLAVVPQSFRTARLIRMHGGHAFFSKALGRDTRPWREWQERRSFTHATHLCAVSRYVAEATRRFLKLGDRPVEVLPNPVNTEYFKPMPHILEQNGLILFAGTLIEKKGVRQLIQAMPAIVRAIPDARLLILGRDTRDSNSGRPFSAVLQEAIPPVLAGKVTFGGEVDSERLRQSMASAALCIFPSHMEAMPIAWLEAMAMGKAVVASQSGPGPEVITDGVSGLLCNPHDPESIAHKVVIALSDASLRTRLGVAARQRAVDEFSLQAMTRRNLEFYRACANDTSRTIN